MPGKTEKSIDRWGWRRPTSERK